MNHLQALLNKIDSLENELTRLKSIRDRLGGILEQDDLIRYIQDISIEAAPLKGATFSERRDGPAEDRIFRMFEQNRNQPRTVRQIQEELSMTEYQVRNTIYGNRKFERYGAKKFRLVMGRIGSISEEARNELPPLDDDFPGIARPLSDSPIEEPQGNKE